MKLYLFQKYFHTFSNFWLEFIREQSTLTDPKASCSEILPKTTPSPLGYPWYLEVGCNPTIYIQGFVSRPQSCKGAKDRKHSKTLVFDQIQLLFRSFLGSGLVTT